MQDNGPGILKKQIPLIFGKLLYGSKFHRLRMSRGQQGIGISAAGMYGVLTTGKPVKIISKISRKKPAHYYEIQIDTKKNQPEILNGRGEGVDIPPGEAGRQVHREARHRVGRDDQSPGSPRHAGDDRAGGQVTSAAAAASTSTCEQTAIANPHVTLHYIDPGRQSRPTYRPRRPISLPPEPKEIKPHPYGVELGRLVDDAQGRPRRRRSRSFSTSSFSRVSPAVARRICEAAKLSPRAPTRKIGRHEADALYQAIQQTKIAPRRPIASRRSARS